MKTEDKTNSNDSFPADEIPGINFSAFIFSLSHTANMQLEEAQNGGESGKAQLILAKQTIEILEMLKEKTQGNRERDEEKMLASLLFDLRMRFVEAKKKCI